MGISVGLKGEPSLNPPETEQDREDDHLFRIYKSLKNINYYVNRPRELELEMEHWQAQLQDEENEINRNMYCEDHT